MHRSRPVSGRLLSRTIIAGFSDLLITKLTRKGSTTLSDEGLRSLPVIPYLRNSIRIIAGSLA